MRTPAPFFSAGLIAPVDPVSRTEGIPPCHVEQVEGAEKIRLLPPTSGNPRSSGGGFIELTDGKTLFIFTNFSSIGDRGGEHLAGRYSSDGGSRIHPVTRQILIA